MKNCLTLNLQGKNYRKLNLLGYSCNLLLSDKYYLNLVYFRLAIKYIRHLQFLLASPPGSTVDFEATNFSLEPLPPWRSIGFASSNSGPSTSSEIRHNANSSYDFSSILLRHSQQQQIADSTATESADILAHQIDQTFVPSAGEIQPYSCTYEDASPLNWTQSN